MTAAGTTTAGTARTSAARRLTGALLFPLLGACLAVSGCLPVVGMTGGQSTSTPQVGQCYATPDNVLADAHDPTPAVDCSQPHSLETYAVLRPAHALDRQTMARMDQQCVQRIKPFLGGDFVQTAVSVYYFTPTPAQQRDGVRWVRCDAGVVTDTAVSGARPVTGSLRDAFAHGVPEAYRRCVNRAPDPAEPLPLVPCTRPHVAEQMPAGVDLGDASTKYPGTKALTRRANAQCAQVVSSQLPEAGRSLVVVPTQSMWRGGLTTAQCWALAPPGKRLGQSEAKPA